MIIFNSMTSGIRTRTFNEYYGFFLILNFLRLDTL